MNLIFVIQSKILKLWISTTVWYFNFMMFQAQLFMISDNKRLTTVHSKQGDFEKL